jgi:hypothetical protein
MQKREAFPRVGRGILARALRRPRSLALVVLAVVAASGAVTAAAALSGDVPTANNGPVEASVTATDTGTATVTPTSSESATPTATTDNGTPGDEDGSQNDANDDGGATPTDGTGTPGASPSGTATHADPHSNGEGCDDIIHGGTATPGPGGPVGCTVGNSGDHRQNGKTATPTGTATGTPTGTATDSPTPDATDTGTPTASANDPHSNGHGCDDVNPAVTDGQPSHGGPVGCTVGNSGDHRQNGKATSTPDATGTADATGTDVAAPTGHGKKK